MESKSGVLHNPVCLGDTIVFPPALLIGACALTSQGLELSAIGSSRLSPTRNCPLLQGPASPKAPPLLRDQPLVSDLDTKA